MDKYIADPIRVRLLQEQYDALWALAEHRGKNIVDLIREGVATVLANAPEDIPALVAHYNQAQEPWPDDRPIEENPGWAIVNDGPLGTSTAATEHDKVLAEIFAEEQQRWSSAPAPLPQSK
ncbi:MAG: hypothetical protein M3Z04_18375 [Chloroflexota bacterium]|nr:hypothetical protein [Chloroflexota bacterium]